MNETQRIFIERKEEIELYYSHISTLEGNSDPTLYKILKANIILMLYNLVEASISNAIDAIRSTIHNDINTNFDSLKAEIKIQIIKDLKRNINSENFIKMCNTLSRDIIKLSFNKSKVSSGNIDKDLISDLANTYGFNIHDSNYYETAHGATLVSLKQKRNDLAHGTFSFSEVGKNYSLQDIEQYMNQTIKYIGYVLNNITNYLSAFEYRKVS